MIAHQRNFAKMLADSIASSMRKLHKKRRITIKDELPSGNTIGLLLIN
jgi:hypothetical protein